MSLKKQRIVYALIIILAFIVFLSTIWGVFLSTHDDICYYMYAQLNKILEHGIIDAKNTGRFYFTYTIFLYCLPYIFNSFFWLKFVWYFSILFSVFCLWYLVNRHFDKKLAIISVLLFLGLAQIDTQHNVFISFIFHHQITIGFILLSISFLLDYFKNTKRKYIILSCIFYSIPLFMYEAYIFYIVALYAISLICSFQKIKSKGNIRIFFVSLYKLRFHIATTIIFLVIYFIYQKSFPTTYDGAKFTLGYIPSMIKTVFYFGTGLFPLRASYMAIKDSSISNILNNINVLAIINSFGISFGIISLIDKVKPIRIKNGFFSLAVCVFSIFLPAIPYGLTNQYVDWMNQGTYGYVPSYFSYFFIILALAIIISFIYKRVKHKKIFKICLFSMIFICTLITFANNKYVVSKYIHTQQRYKSFDRIVSSNEFLNIGEQSVVYIPDYTGIHYSMQKSELYLKIYTDKTIYLTKNSDELNFDNDVYEIRYFSDCNITVFAKIDSDYKTTELFILQPENNVSDLIIRSGQVDMFVYQKGEEETYKFSNYIYMNDIQINRVRN